MKQEIVRKACKLYAITDRRWLTHMSENDELAAQVEQAILGGITMLQLREKALSGEALKKEAIVIQQLCKRYNIPFIMNDYVELAKELQADGVHIGQSDCSVKKAREILGPDYIIGVTAKTVEQAQLAYEQGADYLGSGAVFGTTTKLDAKPMTQELLHQITQSVPIPVVAIGGIQAQNVTQLSGSGIAGVAVIGGIFGEKDIKKAASELRQKLDRMK